MYTSGYAPNGLNIKILKNTKNWNKTFNNPLINLAEKF